MYTSLCYFFFFFKQKTAYEMRISDWSSDVCSSDLRRRERDDRRFDRAARTGRARCRRLGLPVGGAALFGAAAAVRAGGCRGHDDRDGRGRDGRAQCRRSVDPVDRCRSEEHTSELQSLMRISYAVFCLKKKITT